MENQEEAKLKEWKKYFSKSRQRDYYFNSITNKSLWTLDEVKQLIREEIEKQDQACAIPFELNKY